VLHIVPNANAACSWTGWRVHLKRIMDAVADSDCTIKIFVDQPKMAVRGTRADLDSTVIYRPTDPTSRVLRRLQKQFVKRSTVAATSAEVLSRLGAPEDEPLRPSCEGKRVSSTRFAESRLLATSGRPACRRWT